MVHPPTASHLGEPFPIRRMQAQGTALGYLTFQFRVRKASGSKNWRPSAASVEPWAMSNPISRRGTSPPATRFSHFRATWRPSGVLGRPPV